MATIRLTKSEKRQTRKATKTTKTQAPEFSLAPLSPKNTAQAKYLSAIQKHQQVFALGPAGAGKTYLATHYAVQEIMAERCKKFIVARPMISSDRSENIGFLPGDLNMKFTPWAIPILDVIEKLVGKVRAQEWLRKGTIEFAPFQFMRGRTFDEGAIVLLDEAQNCTKEQLRLFVTRLGECKVIISGDPQQSDIRDSGLTYVVALAKRYQIGAEICRFSSRDIVRSRLCQAWVEAFDSENDFDVDMKKQSEHRKDSILYVRPPVDFSSERFDAD